MVSVRHKLTALSSKDGKSIQTLLDAVAHLYAPAEIDEIRSACALAEPLYDGKLELTGAPLLQHALGAAAILVGMNMDSETIAATILHAVPEYLDDWGEVLETSFGPNVRSLVEGISRMEQIRQFSEMPGLHKKKKEKGDDVQQVESLRKMLLAMVEDIRVVLIKLAERTQTLRCLSGADAEQQKLIAQETHSIFAPLANRLGVWQIKWELEDLSMRYLEPDLYRKIARLLDERRIDREQYIADVIARLKRELQGAGIEAEVTGRPKHIHSIINKMKRKRVDFSQLYDVRAVRILVDDVGDCYAALGLVNDLWQPIPEEFDDYIAHPKSNSYRSLHTAVAGPRGLPLEVQIRTFEMHQHSELGVAAHWRYKEGGKSDAGFDEKIAWLRQILEWKEEVAERGEMLAQFKSELFQDQVYVLTPQGKVIDLHKGATPVDFAYALHTDLGHRTRGAKVDGNIVPLSYKLQNGQRVEILTAKQGAPSRDWLNPALGYLQSARARAKVRHWFNHQNFDENVAHGRAQLDRELHRLGVATVNQEKIAQKLRFHKTEDFLAAFGRGDIAPRRLALAVQEAMPATPVELPKPVAPKPAAEQASTTGILVEGMGNLMTKVAKCCQPVPPDPIVGYVTSGRGITIHRQNCTAMLRLAENRRDRMLGARWASGKGANFAVRIEVESHDRQGLLRDIGDLFVREKVNVTRMNSLSKNHRALMRFTVELTDMDQLPRLLALIPEVPGVIAARRHY
ncbi:MAG TPA: bifunctional (p)ppGpp synthetase/guanosine-3',5'-bis(diphosphate) 3'-pyrophosphohydrolase [Novimethylophilus sp.]|jgi:GTP pyrophosphokinase|uniref:RelA/SpoT family protein n=1 Tax=Novimethylophilus sp. TaxID=2137426 RepID=UPI002F41EC28